MKQSTNLNLYDNLVFLTEIKKHFTMTLFPFDDAKLGCLPPSPNYFEMIMDINGLFLTYINILCTHTKQKQ